MDIDTFLKRNIKIPKQIGSLVLVHNGEGRLIETHKTIDLGIAYFSMSNDTFYDIYGFNFVPSGLYWERSKRAAGKM